MNSGNAAALEQRDRIVETPVPLVDLGAQYRALRSRLLPAIEETIESMRFINGPRVRQFEERFSVAMGAAHGIGCSSGTAALELALRGLGVGPGDEVVTVANTFFATAESIMATGAHVVFADIDPRCYTLDPAGVEKVLTSRTRAIVPVHLYGTPSDMTGLSRIARRHQLPIVEDAAQAHLARYKGRCVGTLASAAAFSFYPGKNLGAYGDAGFVTARRKDVADRIRKFLDHGRRDKYEHDVVGYNHRMDSLQAAVLDVKLEFLEDWNRYRRGVAQRYDRALAPAGFKVIEPSSGAEPIYHLYVVEVSNRDEVLTHLARHGIQAGVHYPVPLHRQPALRGTPCAKVSLPNTDRAASRVLSLPICGSIQPDIVDRVIERFFEVARP